MKSTLAPGLSASTRLTVDRDRTIHFLGESARVYATPALLRDIETTARDLLLAHLDPGEDSVGTRVELDHVAATLLGMSVDIAVRVVEVKGRAVTLEFEGRDAVEPICRGRHQRFVVDVQKTEERLAAKMKKAAQD